MRVAMILCAVLVIAHAKRISESQLVCQLLTNTKQASMIKNGKLYLKSKVKVDTANVLECAGIAGCSTVVFVSGIRHEEMKVK